MKPAMVLSSRQPPGHALRRAALADGLRGPPSPMSMSPMSSTSSRFSLSLLVQSPPPSPGLPALIPRHGKPATSPAPRRLVRVVLWLAGVLSIVYFAYVTTRPAAPAHKVGWAPHDDQEYELVAGDTLPDEPSPVVVTNKRGRTRWTVSIPPASAFPLEPEVYGDLCHQSAEAASHVAALHHPTHVQAAHYSYYHVDPYFLDVADAIEQGLLSDVPQPAMDPPVGAQDVCVKSMTFVMETSDAGFGSTLMMLWMAYGLAQKEKRAFFIDDSRWAYGKYTSFFGPPPVPKCRPPPRHEMLPCPHHARHLVVSAATARWTFGGAFNDYFEDGRKMGVYRQRTIYEFARTGYEALFRLAEADAAYVEKRIEEIEAKAVVSAPEGKKGFVIGVHVRHGDCHPLEFQYSDSYIPLDRYRDKVADISHGELNSSRPGGNPKSVIKEHGAIVIASDDPDVYESEEFSHAMRAQEQIRLASKNAMPPAVREHAQSDSIFRRFVDEAVGWEGGFFASMFWNLGQVTMASASLVEPPDRKMPPTEEVLRLRELVGRAYLMDLAVLGSASDLIVCTVSAMGCRLLAVIMGWESAFDHKGWVNIDGEYDWKGVPW